MKNIIKFILDDKVIEIDFSIQTKYNPTLTVLNYLRSLNNHKGIKEGCAEGDCGACTIVLAEINDNGVIQYKTIDSCLVFLPMINGKQIITIENLETFTQGKSKLHFVQKSLVDTNGTQCGYCTPGVVMSLFGIYKNYINPSKEIIENSLAGNLCRCTGYKSIVDAAQIENVRNRVDKFSYNENFILKALKEINLDRETIFIDNGKQKYIKPFSISEAIKYIKNNSDAIIINGSTDIALRQTKKNEFFPKIIDLSDVYDLKHIKENEKSYNIGSGTCIENLRKYFIVKLPELYEILTVFASLQIRNIATIGGNIASASPIGDLLPLLFAYRAKIKLKSLNNDRLVDIEKFILGYRKTDLKKDEIISEIIIPKNNGNKLIKSYKISKRKNLDIATVHGAFSIAIEKNIITDIIIAFGGMSDMTKRAINTEKFFLGKKWTRKNVELAMLILENEFTPLSDARASSNFRKVVAKNLLLKFFIESKLEKSTF